MVNVTNRADVAMRLRTFKLLFRHRLSLIYLGRHATVNHSANSFSRQLSCGAGGGNRTHITSLEGWGSTIELRPPRKPVMFTQCLVAPELSFQKPNQTLTNCRLSVLATPKPSGWWRGLDSNQRRRTPAGLQPAPFSHSGTPPISNPVRWKN